MKVALMILLAIILAGMSSWKAAVAQEEESEDVLKFNLEIRIRGEEEDRNFDLGDYNSFTLLRTRFSATIKPLPNLAAFVQMQDSRVYGQEPSTLAHTGNVDLHQAYVKASGVIWRWLDVQFGRFEANLGEERLVGAVGWSNVGRSFDGSRLTFNLSQNFRLDLIGARLQEASLVGLDDENDYDFSTLYASYVKSDRFKGDFYIMGEVDGTDVAVSVGQRKPVGAGYIRYLPPWRC